MITYPTYCCICGKEVMAELVDGGKIYPHNIKLHSLNFYRCPHCYGYVGTNKRTNKPLGHIVSKDVKRLRMTIHSILDPMWFPDNQKRDILYKRISAILGYDYHTANICNAEEANKILAIIYEIKENMQ